MNIETANNLLKYRKKNGLSQEELAEKIGVSRQAVSKWERGEASPDTDNLILLAQIYGVTLDELLTGKMTDSEKNDSTEQNTEQSSDNCCDSSSTDSQNNDNAETTEKPRDYVSFDNGIHIHSKDGDKVDIGFGGVHVHDKHGTKVDVDKNGVTVIDADGSEKVFTDENGKVINKHSHDDNKKNFWVAFPFPVLVVIAFLIWGFLGGWWISWILFLTIPLYYTTVDAIRKKKPSHFAYPVLVVMVYLLLGLYLSLWHPAWVLFLTIPLYYWVCDCIKRK